jgi:hypothetical protein
MSDEICRPIFTTKRYWVGFSMGAVAILLVAWALGRLVL